MTVCDLIGQRLNKLAVQRTGGDPHMVGFGGEIEASPHGGAEDNGTENAEKPGMAQKHPHPASHHMFKRLETHGVTR